MPTFALYTSSQLIKKGALIQLKSFLLFLNDVNRVLFREYRFTVPVEKEVTRLSVGEAAVDSYCPKEKNQCQNFYKQLQFSKLNYLSTFLIILIHCLALFYIINMSRILLIQEIYQKETVYTFTENKLIMTS
jgi:hypothetical protein